MAEDIKIDNNLKGVVNQTAAAFFDYIRPTILMVGQWDDYFSIIKTQYKWADHAFSPPGRIKKDVSLIITNNRHYFNMIVSMVNGAGLDLAIIVYDDTQVIPVEERLARLSKVCYLRSSSPRYINGHIRSMLQLQRWLFGVKEDYPLILTDPEMLNRMHQIIVALDKGLPINTITGNSYYFFLLFKTMVAETHYDFVRYIDHIDQFDELASHEYTTLFLNINSIEEYDQYLKKPIMEYTIVFVSRFEIEDKHVTQIFDMNQLTRLKSVFFLSAYYYSLQQNLIDQNNQTRFVQIGDLNKIYSESDDFFEFYQKLKNYHKSNSLRFKNMAPMIRGANYGLYPLDALVDQLVSAIYNEFFEQSNFALEHAEMVSGVKRSTLQPKLGKLQRVDSES